MATAFGSSSPIVPVENRSAAAGDAYDVFGASDLGFDDMRSVARRQLTASIAVGIVIAAIAGLMAARPVPHQPQYAAAHKYSAVQQPVFVTPSQHMLAAIKGATELP